MPRAAAFPFFATWFAPLVPAGTAFDLHARALLPGCPRPPTPAQVKLWAQAAPDHYWTVWSAEYLNWDRPGKPTGVATRRALGVLMDYDYVAALKVLDYSPMTTGERIEVAQKICGISTDQCDRVALLLLEDAREPEAVAVYERWIAASLRDRVGRIDRPHVAGASLLRDRETRAGGRKPLRMAADVASSGGLETLAHLLDASGRSEEAEATYREIASHYGNTGPLGTFFVRRALRTGERKDELKGWEYLRETFPMGMQPLAMHALDAPPVDGVVLTSFGRRVSAVKLEPADIIVGVDDLRVRTQQQYKVATRLRYDENMTLTVWRRGQYHQLRTRVPGSAGWAWAWAITRDHRRLPDRHLPTTARSPFPVELFPVFFRMLPDTDDAASTISGKSRSPPSPSRWRWCSPRSRRDSSARANLAIFLGQHAGADCGARHDAGDSDRTDRYLRRIAVRHLQRGGGRDRPSSDCRFRLAGLAACLAGAMLAR